MDDVVIAMLAQGYTRAQIAAWQARVAEIKAAKKPSKKAANAEPVRQD